MKIGIVTVQDSNNFGSFLQAYALQSILQELGHEVFFIRSRSKKYIKSIFYCVRPSKQECLHLFTFLKQNWNGWKKYRRFQAEQTCFRVLNCYKDEELDLVILGSDEIWNVNTRIFRTPVFYGVDMEPVMAYAVSIGNAAIDDMQCIPQEYFKHISPILVRDNHTADFLKVLQVDSKVVCDPTLLVEKSIFYRPYQSKLLNGKPFILVYSYGLSDQIVESIRAFAKRNNLRILSACFPFPWCDGVFECAALDFCAILEQAEFVFTSTFHGTIFSVLNHKQFVSLPQSRKTSDLLKTLNLSERLIRSEGCTPVELQEKLINQNIDYSGVDADIERMRSDSLRLLKDALKKYE